MDLHGVKDITVKAGKDYEVHIPCKCIPKGQAQVMIDDREMVNDDRVNVKVSESFLIDIYFFSFIYPNLSFDLIGD